MRAHYKKVATVCLAALTAALVPMIAASGSHQATYEVKVASPLTNNAESMRFLPSSLRVHDGDKIHFTSESFHTATLLPIGESAQEWLDANAAGTNDPFSIFLDDPDDGPGAVKQNIVALTPNRTDCGPLAGGTPCVFDGKEVLNSGFPFDAPFDFTVEVDAKAGDVFWVVCLVHTHMRMKVTVVADDQAASDPFAIEADNAEKLAADRDWAVAMDARMENRQTRHETADGRTVWDVFQGVDNHWVAISETYPKELDIKKGDVVRWHFDQLIYENHTATSRTPEAFELELFNLVCDPDGDSGPGPDTPANSEEPEPCPEVSQIEQDFEGRIAEGTGNGVFRGEEDLETSGIMGQSSLGQFESLDVRFPERTGKKPIRFVCIFHGRAMWTKVNVAK